MTVTNGASDHRALTSGHTSSSAKMRQSVLSATIARHASLSDAGAKGKNASSANIKSSGVIAIALKKTSSGVIAKKRQVSVFFIGFPLAVMPRFCHEIQHENLDFKRQ
ncbi:MAG: hypothetical protein ACK5QX_03325 [bacterium]